ncbi:hypothetical protein Taro_023605 [Colocasia esculenta]|uniref:Uncharacterized protein n=1 Tax=Colocasia esculenta TaxID=4460 RepID=A0A843UXV9_COLES|nr:hypothetical protein [Colocasia esculenta]
MGLRPCGPQVRARRTFHDRRPAQSRAVAVQGQYLQRCSSSCVVLQQCSLLYLGVCPRLLYFFSVLWKFGYASARSREADSDQVRYRFNGLGRGIPPQLVSEQEIAGMADRRDWGGGGNDPEESTQRMIERIWESLADIRARMDQQAPVPPVAVPPGDGEAVPVAPVPPRVEVPFCSTCATTTTSVDSRRTSDAGGEVSEIAATYLFRRAKSRYS